MIDSRAIVDPTAKIGSGVSIGPWTIIEGDVEIGDGTKIESHVVIKSHTRIGKNNHIYQFSSIGEAPQDTSYEGQPTWLEIGDNNLIREFCTISRGTTSGCGVTRIGNKNFIMAYVHIAHDCQIGNEVTLINNAALAGHVKVNDFARVGGFVAVHQRVTIGAYSFVTGALIRKDVLPFIIVTGSEPKLCGLNIVGLRRRGFSSEAIVGLRRAYNLIFRKGLKISTVLAELESMLDEFPDVQLFIDAMNQSSRGILRNGEEEISEAAEVV